MHRIEEIEKALNLLDTYDGQLSKIARALGINRYTLRSWRDKRKKVCTPLEVLSLYQTCRSNMELTVRLELMTCCLGGNRSIQLSYVSIC